VVLAGGVGHHHVLANSTSLLQHFHCYSVSVFCSPQERSSTVFIRSVGSKIFLFQKHLHCGLVPISGYRRRMCSIVFIRVLGAISPRSGSIFIISENLSLAATGRGLRPSSFAVLGVTSSRFQQHFRNAPMAIASCPGEKCSNQNTKC